MPGWADGKRDGWRDGWMSGHKERWLRMINISRECLRSYQHLDKKQFILNSSHCCKSAQRNEKESEAKQGREKKRNDNAPVVSSLGNRLTGSSGCSGWHCGGIPEGDTWGPSMASLLILISYHLSSPDPH